MGFMDFIKDNFLHVAPILIAAAIAVAIMAERFKTLYQTYPMKDLETFFDKVGALVIASKIQEAADLCDKHSEKPVAKVTKAALTRAHLPETVIQDGVQMALSHAVQAIHKRTSFLATIANVATLLGLFGTIAGLIHSFEAVGHADPQQKSALLSAGIAQAMNATMMGLAVAIPCMIAFSTLTNRSNALVADLETSALRVMDILKQRFYSADVAAEEATAASKVVNLRKAS